MADRDDERPGPAGFETTRVLGPTPAAPPRPTELGSAPTTPGAAPAPTAAPSARIGRYQLGGLLGQGGMGKVYRARDPELDRALAIKLVRGSTDDPGHARVLREAQAMARLRHPHVVPVFDVGVHDGQVFLVMPLYEGGTLGAWLRAARRPWREVVTRFVAAARGLAAAHAVGLVHRDFKPDNVLIGADHEIQVADFGLARAAGDAEPGAPAASGALALDVTAAGTVIGTPAYMAPEQLDGAPVDARADQFSFCVALYEALYGQRPFDGTEGARSDPSTLREAIRSGRVARRAPVGDVPAWLRAIVLRGLRAEPAGRWPSMPALVDAIERGLRRPRRWLWAGLATAVVAGGAAGALVLGRDATRPGAPTGGGVERATRVTFAGCAAAPTWASDGRLAYVTRRGSASSLVLAGRQVGGERDLGPGAAPAFSPDGRRLAALVHGRLAVLDLADGTRRDLGPSTSGPTWLGDDELVVGVGDEVRARALADGRERVLGRIPAGAVVRATAAGADGRVFVIHRPDAALAEAVVAELTADGARELRRGVLSTAGLRYRADARVVYYVQRRNSAQYQVFAQRVDGAHEPAPLATDTQPTGGFDVDRAGRRLALSTCAESAAVYRLAADGAPTRVSTGGAWRDNAPVVVDDDRLVHTSNRSGLLQLWLHERKAGSDRLLVAAESSQPSLSADRTTLVFATVGPGQTLELRRAPLARPDDARPLTAGHVDRAPRPTRDGAAVVFLRTVEAGQALYRVAMAGGEATPLWPDGEATAVRAFDLSPVDERLTAIVPGDGGPLLEAGLDGSGRRVVSASPALGGNLRLVRYAPDGSRLLLVDSDARLVELDRASGAVRARWSVDGTDYSAIGAATYDVDGEAILASLTSLAGDLWLLDGRF